VDFFEVGAAIRLEVLQADGLVCAARVDSQAGQQIQVTCQGHLELDALVRLDGSDCLVIGEVVGVDRLFERTTACIDVQHYLSIGNMPAWFREEAIRTQTRVVSTAP